MAFYNKSTPTVETAIAARIKLRGRLADAEAAILTAKTAATALALADASDGDLSAAEGKTRDCIDRKTTLTAALAESDIQVAELEAARDEAADQKQRLATVKDNENREAELIEVGNATVAWAIRMSAISAQIIPIAPEANGIKHFADITVVQIPDAVTLLSRLIREHSAAVLRRDAPSTVKTPEAPYVPPAPVPEESKQTIFATRAIKWRDENNVQQITGNCRDVYLPTRLVEKALASGTCISTDNPRRKELARWPQEHPRLTTAYDLDDADISAPGPTLAEPIRQSDPQFAETIGEPYTIKARAS